MPMELATAETKSIALYKGSCGVLCQSRVVLVWLDICENCRGRGDLSLETEMLLSRSGLLDFYDGLGFFGGGL